MESVSLFSKNREWGHRNIIISVFTFCWFIFSWPVPVTYKFIFWLYMFTEFNILTSFCHCCCCCFLPYLVLLIFTMDLNCYLVLFPYFNSFDLIQLYQMIIIKYITLLNVLGLTPQLCSHCFIQLLAKSVRKRKKKYALYCLL